MNEINEVVYRLRQGQSVSEIGRTLSLSRMTVRKYREAARAAGLLASEAPLPEGEALAELLGPRPLPPHQRSTLEPHAVVVREMLENGVEGMAIWQRLRESYGYTGSYSAVRRYLQRSAPPERGVVCRIETVPGQQAQVDFGYAGLQRDPVTGELRKAWVFVMTLSWSRHQYAEVVWDQRMGTWLALHERAFAWFGGAVKQVVLDNLKAGVAQCLLYDPVLSEPYRRLARHYGFVIAPCRARTPRHKGKVESGVHYVKRNFLAGQTFADLECVNARLKQWVMGTAGERCHGTVHEAPLARFARGEQAVLLALPQEPYEWLSAHLCKVHHDCHVVVEGRFYSVSYEQVGQQVEVYVGRRIVEVYRAGELLTTHLPLAEHGLRATRNEHYPAGKRAWLDNPPEVCHARAAAVGAECLALVATLLADPVQERLRSVQALLRLEQPYGRERLEAACRRARCYGDGSYRRVKTILVAGLDEAPLLAGTAELSPTSAERGAGYQYARSAASFFVSEEVH